MTLSSGKGAMHPDPPVRQQTEDDRCRHAQEEDGMQAHDHDASDDTVRAEEYNPEDRKSVV